MVAVVGLRSSSSILIIRSRLSCSSGGADHRECARAGSRFQASGASETNQHGKRKPCWKARPPHPSVWHTPKGSTFSIAPTLEAQNLDQEGNAYLVEPSWRPDTGYPCAQLQDPQLEERSWKQGPLSTIPSNLEVKCRMPGKPVSDVEECHLLGFKVTKLFRNTSPFTTFQNPRTEFEVNQISQLNTTLLFGLAPAPPLMEDRFCGQSQRVAQATPGTSSRCNSLHLLQCNSLGGTLAQLSWQSADLHVFWTVFVAVFSGCLTSATSRGTSLRA